MPSLRRAASPFRSWEYFVTATLPEWWLALDSQARLRADGAAPVWVLRIS